MAEFGDVDENDFGFELAFVEVFHGLEIEVVTEVATGIFRDDWVEAGNREALGEFREIDFGVISDTIVATDGFETNGQERGGLSMFARGGGLGGFLVAEHFTLTEKDDEFIVVRGKLVAESGGSGFKTILKIKFVVWWTVDMVQQSFAGIGSTSEGCEQSSHENIIAQIETEVRRIALNYYL